MEEVQAGSPQTPSVSFPETTQRPKPKKSGWIWVILIVLLAAAVGGFFILKGSEESTTTPTPTPLVEETEKPVATPKPVDKEDIKIEILNGTGIPGEAAFLQGQLKTLGYTDIDLGNAEDSSAKATKVTFTSGISDDVKQEIIKKLESIYSEVDSSTGKLSAGKDIQITTGVRKGASPRPSSTPRATPRASASPSASPL